MIRRLYDRSNLPFIVIAAVFVVVSLCFAMAQTIWVDETTQLSGLTLSPIAVIKWLAGYDVQRFGVPGDRSPPLSYILGWGWSKIVGDSPYSLRLFGIFLVTTAAVPIWLAAKRLGGIWGGCVATVFFCFSPNVIAYGVEIRPYPLYLAISSFGFWLLVRAVLSENRKTIQNVWLLCLMAICASYAHFFGLFFGGAVLSAALIVLYGQGRPLRHAIAASAVFIVSLAGILPFMPSRIAIIRDSPVSASDYAQQLVRLAYRLVAHPASAVSFEFLSAYLLGIALILGAGSFGLRLIEFRRRDTGRFFSLPEIANEPFLGFFAILIALLAGVTATIAASFILGEQDAFAPRYNLWMIPGVSLLLAASVGIVREKAAPYSHYSSIILMIGALCLFVGSVGGLFIFSKNMAFFTHGPSRTIAEIVERQPPGTPLYYDKSSNWGLIYFPLFYKYGSGLDQYLLETVNTVISVRQIGRPGVPLHLTGLKYAKRMILVTAENWGSEDIRRAIQDHRAKIENGPEVARLIANGNWKVIEDTSSVSFVAARVLVVERAE